MNPKENNPAYKIGLPTVSELQQQLAAAHAARVSAQASGIRLLDQLTEAKEECDTLRRIHAENITILECKTAQAVAACKLKDEELEKIRGHIGLYNLFSCVGSDSYDPECADLNVGKCREIATKALTIQPGTEALEKWLGEPVAIIGKHGHPKHISAIPSIEENRLYGPFEPLYAKPKGLK